MVTLDSEDGGRRKKKGRERERTHEACRSSPIVPTAVLEPKKMEAQASGRPPVQEHRH